LAASPDKKSQVNTLNPPSYKHVFMYHESEWDEQYKLFTAT
jgi:hypothetical protein